MNVNRKTAIITGILFLLGYLGVFWGSAVYAPILDAPDYLTRVYPNRSQVINGMLIELINDVSVIGIGVMLFPIFKRHSEQIALGYAVIRLLEAAVSIFSKFSVLSLIQLSEEYIAAGDSAAAYFQVLGTYALAERYWAGDVMLTIFFILGSVLLYYLLYQSRLVPRLISAWGLFAVASLTVANVLGVPAPVEGFHPAMLLYLPMFLSEIILALWLIVKGFNPTALASGADNRQAFRGEHLAKSAL